MCKLGGFANYPKAYCINNPSKMSHTLTISYYLGHVRSFRYCATSTSHYSCERSGGHWKFESRYCTESCGTSSHTPTLHNHCKTQYSVMSILLSLCLWQSNVFLFSLPFHVPLIPSCLSILESLVGQKQWKSHYYQ